MVQSIIEDIKAQFRYGNKVVQIILVNFMVFLAIVLVRSFTPGGATSGAFNEFMTWIALPSAPFELLKHPWTLLSHMFVHQGFWHIAWNMMMLYWFGRIVGDLIGDKKIVPLYIAGGLFGAMFYFVFANIFGYHGIAYGASAAVMSFVTASAVLAPEYNMRLLLLGDVKLKYIAIGLVFLNLVMISEASNVGGRIAHIGGAIFGGLYIYLLRDGTDLLGFAQGVSFPKPKSSRPSPSNTKMEVVHSQRKKTILKKNKAAPIDLQKKVDEILDKINESGYESLSAEDKEILFQASKSK